jgi:glycosyltransferase involved in cell wall biosynthesis
MISFVLPAHNEESHLPGALAAIHAAAKSVAREYEIIVADDASTDRTAGVAREGGARVVSIQARQIAAARNAGAGAATGEYLFFVDADTRVTPEAVAQALMCLDKGAAGGGGPMRFDPPVPLWARIALPVFQLLFRVLHLTGGAFLFCTRSAFDAAGGWDQTLFASEEIALAKALKKHGRFRIVRAPVVTSGRKLRTYSGWELWRMMLRLGVRGHKGMQSREHLELWYGPRRTESSKAANQQSSK